jgi:hypothetical protein
MKTLIRDLDTGLFYCRPGQWVDVAVRATQFPDPDSAAAEAKMIEKPNLEVYVLWDDWKPAWGAVVPRD